MILPGTFYGASLNAASTALAYPWPPGRRRTPSPSQASRSAPCSAWPIPSQSASTQSLRRLSARTGGGGELHHLPGHALQCHAVSGQPHPGTVLHGREFGHAVGRTGPPHRVQRLRPPQGHPRGLRRRCRARTGRGEPLITFPSASFGAMQREAFSRVPEVVKGEGEPLGIGESQGHGPQVNVQTEAFGTGDPK